MSLIGEYFNLNRKFRISIPESTRKSIYPNSLTIWNCWRSIFGEAQELIQEESKYGGVRVKLTGTLEKAKVVVQIDVGFGDAVFPPPIVTAFPTMLEFDAPKMKMYSKEAVVAEKFQTMVQRGTLNSRMKDFFDIHLLSKQFFFNGSSLAEAITQTFAHRKTELQSIPLVFQEAFSKNENIKRQWRAFLKKSMDGMAPDNIEEVLLSLNTLKQNKCSQNNGSPAARGNSGVASRVHFTGSKPAKPFGKRFARAHIAEYSI